ncbi:LysR family transcriptional regulator [Streptomyces sp. NPDC020800]|uniref:LysR family transcriptional regulator n=1 Tax=Streptomyces sp. NPDC020800 TaxID=3365092 RepID=UPI0037B7403A
MTAAAEVLHADAVVILGQSVIIGMDDIETRSGEPVTLDLHRLWIFMQVVESQGFSAAAQKLYMSQPSVSNQVRRLEASLRTTLIDRSGARMRPTPEGELLNEYGRKIFLLSEEAVVEMERVRGLERGRLFIGGSTTVGTYLLPRLVARFRAQCPAVETHIVVGNNEKLHRDLLNGNIGIAVVAGTSAESRFTSENVLEDRMVVIASGDHLLAGRPSISLQELSEERFLVRESGSQTRELQERVIKAWGLESCPRSDVWSPEALKRCVAAGVGLSLVSEHAIRDELTLGSLAVLSVDAPEESRPVSLLQRRDRLLSPSERAFVRLLREQDSWRADAA